MCVWKRCDRGGDCLQKQREALRRVVQFLRQEAAQGGAGVPDASRFLKGKCFQSDRAACQLPHADELQKSKIINSNNIVSPYGL